MSHAVYYLVAAALFAVGLFFGLRRKRRGYRPPYFVYVVIFAVFAISHVLEARHYWLAVVSGLAAVYSAVMAWRQRNASSPRLQDPAT
jgi:uncharacterized membrane protein